MDHPLLLLAPLAGLAGLAASAAFRQRWFPSTPQTVELSALELSTQEELGSPPRQLAQWTLALHGFVFVCLLMLHFAALLPAAVAPAVFLGGLTLAGIHAMSAKLSAKARLAPLESNEDGSVSPGRVLLGASAALGLMATSLALLFVSLSYFCVTALFRTLSLTQSSLLLAYLGFGMALQALLAQLTSGLVGRAESLQPSSNPARARGEIASCISDDADSYTSSLLCSVCLAVAAAYALAPTDSKGQSLAAVLPLALAGLGLGISILGLWRFTHRASQGAPVAWAGELQRAKRWTALAVALSSGLCCWQLLHGLTLPAPLTWTRLWACVVCGVLLSLISSGPTAASSPTDAGAPEPWSVQAAADRLFAGWPLPVALAALLMLTFTISGGGGHPELGLFGLSLGAVGFLSLGAMSMCGAVLGPLFAESAPAASNEGGRSIPQALVTGSVRHSLISSALAAVSLFAVYSAQLKGHLVTLASRGGDVVVWGSNDVDEVALRDIGLRELMNLYQLDVTNPKLLFGWLLGATVLVTTSSFVVRQTAREALLRQESTASAAEEEKAEIEDASGRRAGQRLLFPLANLCLLPLALGLGLGPAGVLGFTLGTLCSGLPLAFLWADSAWAQPDSGQQNLASWHLREAASRTLGVGMKLPALTAVVFTGLTVRWSPTLAEALGLL